MGDAETIILTLPDQVSGPATAMGAAIDKLAARLDAARAKVDALAAAGGEPTAIKNAETYARLLAGQLANAKAKADALASTPPIDPAPIQEAADAAADLATSSEQATAPVEEIGKAISSGASSAGGAKVPFEALAGATTTLGGASGGAAAKGINLIKFLGQLGPYGALAVVAILGVVAAFAALYAIASKALSASDAARSEFLALQGTMKGDAAAALELQAAISQVAAGSALGREKVSDYATSLAKAKLSGGELQRALEAASIAGSAGGDEIATAFLKDVAAAKAAGQSVDALSAKMKAQLGGVARAQLLSLGVQTKKLGENITEIFSGSNVEPFLLALEDSLSLVSQNTVIGQQFKEVITKAMDGFFAAAARVMPYVKEGFVGLAIVAVQLYIAYAKVRNAINEMIGPTDQAGASATGLSIALEAGQAVAWTLVVVFGAIAAVVAAVVAVVAIFYGMFLAIGAAGTWIGDQIVAGFKSIASLDLSSIASGIIDGLINGITGSIGRVVAAMSKLGSSAISAMKAAIGMASPAKAFVEVGEDGIGEGVAVGTEKAEARVDDALGGLVNPADVKADAKAARAGGGTRIAYFEIHTADSSLIELIKTTMRGEFEVEVLDGSPA